MSGNIAMQRDIGAHLTLLNAFNPVTLNANSTTENNVEQNGITIDRELVQPGRSVQLGGKVGLPYSYSLAAAATVTLTANAQHSTSGSTWSDYDDQAGSTGQSEAIGTTASTAAQTGNSSLNFNLDLGGAKRYVRVQLKANFSGSTTADDLDIGGVLVMGGYDTVPASTAA